MKSNLSRNALIGLAFLASLFMIYFGINFLKGSNIFKKQNQYYAIFTDVSKLSISSPVYVKGYQVGLINNIKMIDSDPIQFLVGINLEKDIAITEGSYLEYGIDMFGASTVNLVLASTDRYLHTGDTLSGDKKPDIMDGVDGIVPRANSILLRIDSIAYSLNKLISHPALENSIIGIGATINQLNNSSQSLNKIIKSLETDLPLISQNLNTVSGDLKTMSNELSQLDIKNTYKSIDETINNLKLISEKFNSNENTLGLLMNDTRLHDSLNVTLDNATRLLEDIRKNPDRYLTIRLKLF